MVAACINAETGVGPAIASGNQVNKGICALLPIAPTNKQRVTIVSVISPEGIILALSAISIIDNVLKVLKRMKIPNRKPKSPIRFMIKAFLAALLLAWSLNQNPMSKYEDRPTPSQPINSIK